MFKTTIALVFSLVLGLLASPAAMAGGTPTNPTVNSPTYADVTTTTATLGGNVVDYGNRAADSRGVEWGTSSGNYPNSVTEGGSATGAFTVGVTGLPSNTTIYFRAWAMNSSGRYGYSAEASFTTDSVALTAPTVTVQAASAVGTRGATLNGTITVNGSAADNDTYFEYGTSSGPPYDTTTSTVSTIATGSFSLAISSLSPDTLYYYRACATANEAGGLTGCSSETTFTTDQLVAPTVTAQAATAVTDTSATLNGTVTVNGTAADNNTYFKYGTSPGSYTVTTPSAGTVTTGSFSYGISSLNSETTYYYVACATANESGGLEGCSGELNFTTEVTLTAPTVTAQAATAVDTRSATLNGTVTVNGSAANNDTYFKYGTSPGSYTVTTPSAGTVTTGSFSYGISSLNPDTTYYFIACATANESGGLEGCSGELNFTTDPLVAPTVTAQAATAIDTDSATLHGTVTVNGTAADNDTYFKYGTSSGVYTVTTPSAGTVATGTFNYGISSLNPNATYYFVACATANETGGLEGCSGELNFTTDKLAPTVTAQAATAIGSRTATLNGTVTVNGSAADNDTYFKYGTSPGSYTVTTPSAGTVSTGSFSYGISSLNPDTTYYFIACAVANETGGLEGCSSELNFTTEPLTAPTVTVQAATAIGPYGATLNGTITANGSAPDNDTYFKYGTSSGVYTVTTTSAGTVATGAFSKAITGLDPSTTYFYIACATANESGGLEGCSTETSFVTSKVPPTVTVQPATAIGTNGATLHGTVTVNGSAADNDTYFKYGTSSGVYTVTTASAGTVATGAFSLAVSGLDPSTTYYYIACATANETGGQEGCSAGEESFTTDKIAPTVTAQAATAVATRSATLNGTITVNGSAADNDTYFKYGTSSGVYTVTTPSAGTVATGAFSYGISSLDPETTYYFIACATANEAGGLEGCSGELNFTTESLSAPTVTVQAATVTGSRTATLNGTVTVNGSATDNNTYFEYGTSSGEPYDTTSGTVSTIATGSFALPVTSLEPDTTYYYRACATANEAGGLTGCSVETSFTTDPLSAPTVTAQAATAISSDSATLNGTITVNGSATDNDTYFKYGTSSGVYTVTTPSAGTVATGAFSYGISTLDPDTTYYFIACATANETGGLEGCSGELNFTTNALTAPTITVQAATGVGTNAATLRGTITVNGSAADNDTYFKYGISSGVYTVTTPSAGTVVTGAFSYAVSSLDPDTTYYYIACATANETGGLEGCSGESSFTTVADVSQPTGLWFHNISSTSMTLFWNEGIGDGSIVVMKQGSAVNATPSDGVEHVADSVFGSGAHLGSSNYVVYRGNGESVHVTGLTQSSSYHVAVFTYTGAGAAIEYLLPSPAIGNEATTDYTPHNVAVLNIDETVGCTDGCHGFHGGTIVPRGADQETMCTTCHNPSGMPGALDKLNFSLHTNSKGTPASSPGEVDCGSCHELHNPGVNSTTYSYNPLTTTSDYNLHYLRKNMDKYVSGALSEDAVMHAADAYVLDNSTYFQGPCQICHTDSALPYKNTSSDTGHQGGNQNCKSCHDHGGGFGGGGGDCTGCHNSAQDADGGGSNPGRRAVMDEFSGGSIVSTHLTGTIDAADCEVCHDQTSHQAGQVKLKDPDGGSSISIATYTDPRNSSTEAAKLTAFCEGCHDSNGANGDTTPFSTGATAVDISSDWTNASHNNPGTVGCFGGDGFGCHGSGHGGQKIAILTPAESGPGTNNSDEREQFCFNCHDGSPGIDIWSDFSGTLRTVTSASGAAVSNRHNVLPAEQSGGVVITCGDCHQPHTNSDAQPVTDPDTGLALNNYSISNSYTEDGHNFAYDSGSNLDPTNPEGGGSVTEPDYIQFCLTCHDGTMPSGMTMTSNMLNIATAYNGTDQHGTGEGETGSKTGKGGLKMPWVNASANSSNNDPSQPYAALNCTVCHGAHGTGSIFNLRESITVAGTVMTVGGDGNLNESSYNGSTTYTLPLIGGNQTDHYWGAWCTFCHKVDAHPGKVEADSCTGAHMHGGGSF